jgi:hypothetical protein
MALSPPCDPTDTLLTYGVNFFLVKAYTYSLIHLLWFFQIGQTPSRRSIQMGLTCTLDYGMILPQSQTYLAGPRPIGFGSTSPLQVGHTLIGMPQAGLRQSQSTVVRPNTAKLRIGHLHTGHNRICIEFTSFSSITRVKADCEMGRTKKSKFGWQPISSTKPPWRQSGARRNVIQWF